MSYEVGANGPSYATGEEDDRLFAVVIVKCNGGGYTITQSRTFDAARGSQVVTATSNLVELSQKLRELVPDFEE